jgi:autoinducer 2-degrading protein
MYAVLAKVTVQPEHVERFLRYLDADRKGTIEEAGCLRFDVLRDRTTPNVFYLYEIYRDQAAYDLHRQQPYLQAMFKEAGDTLACPPEGYFADTMWPSENTYWGRGG